MSEQIILFSPIDEIIAEIAAGRMIICADDPSRENEADLIARMTSETMAKYLGTRILVENRPGGGSSLGSAYVAKSPADGYRMVLVSASYTTNAVTRSCPR